MRETKEPGDTDSLFSVNRRKGMNPWQTLRTFFGRQRSRLSWHIASQVWIALISLFVLFNLLVLLQERHENRKQARSLLAESNIDLSVAFTHATAKMLRILESVDDAAGRSDSQQNIPAAVLQEIKLLAPKSETTIQLTEASDSSSAGSTTADRPEKQSSDNPAIATKALANIYNKRTWLSFRSQPGKRIVQLCFNTALSSQSRSTASPSNIGRVISTCWDVNDFDRYVGYQTILSQLIKRAPALSALKNQSTSLSPMPKALFMVVSPNDMIYLPSSRQLVNTREKSIISLLNGQSQPYQRADWSPIAGHLAKMMTKELFDSDFAVIRIGRRDYLIQSLRLGPYWSYAVALDARLAYQEVRKSTEALIVLQLIALTIATIAIFSTSQRIALPISRAVDALKRVSKGDFNIRLAGDYSGELQSLYACIEETSAELKRLVADEISNATKNKQLETARKIQSEFLPQGQYSSEAYSVTASFTPAYDIGADWYDIIETDGLLFCIVADVCDKGVPSALYMGVFRSLLRYTLQDECKETSLGVDGVIRDAVNRVNAYMVETHEVTTMFATVFIAALDTTAMQIHYVSAGHEPALLCSDGQIVELNPTGPAIGIFANAGFESKTLAVKPGDMLFEYTDGLTDAINGDDERWGKSRLHNLLRMLQEESSTDIIVEQVKTAIASFIGTSDQFDDLTLLALTISKHAEQGQA